MIRFTLLIVTAMIVVGGLAQAFEWSTGAFLLAVAVASMTVAYVDRRVGRP